ncbi:MAG: metallophosphoesterase [Comamonas sp.]|nr:metallophosphoesterase [Comamonas sp.]
MLIWGLLAISLLLAVWLWHPLRSGNSGFRYALLALLTVLLGLLPAALIAAMRYTRVDYGLIAHAQVISGWLLAAMLLTAVWALVRDAAALLAGLFGQRGLMCWLWRPAATVLVALGALVLTGYGAWQGLQLPTVREQELPLASLPPELDGLRVAVLADLHASPVNNARYISQVVARANATQPDLIVLPGDLVDGDAATQAGNIAALAQLRARYGVWAAPGNHEYYSGYLAWAAEFARLGLPYLVNQVRTIDIAGQRLGISGVGDPAYYQANNQGGQGLAPDIAAVAAQAREQSVQFHILLGHQPKMAREYAAQGSVDLHIAGHTHGGHILGLDRLVARFNDGFVRGRYDLDGMTLFVSNGAGLWAGFTQRLGVPAAIDVLVLRSSKSAKDLTK